MTAVHQSCGNSYDLLSFFHIIVIIVTFFIAVQDCIVQGCEALQANLVLRIDQPERQTGGHLPLYSPLVKLIIINREHITKYCLRQNTSEVFQINIIFVQ